MNFKVGDRVKVANIEDEGVIQAVKNDHYQVRWPNYFYSNYHWYPAYQVRLAEETLEDFINNYPKETK